MTHSLILLPEEGRRAVLVEHQRRIEDDWIACLQIAAQHLAIEIGRPAQLNLNGHRLSLAEDVDHPLTIYNPDRPVWNEEGIRDLAVVLPAEDGVEGQCRLLAEPDLIDVDLRDLHIDQHPR